MTAERSRLRISEASSIVKPWSIRRYVHSSVETCAEEDEDGTETLATAEAPQSREAFSSRTGDVLGSAGASLFGEASPSGGKAAMACRSAAPWRSIRDGPSPLIRARAAGDVGRWLIRASRVSLVKIT